MKKLFAVLMIALTLALFSSCDEPRSISAFHTWTTSGTLTHAIEVDHWEISVASVDGRAWRDIDFSAQNLGALHVRSANNHGMVRLRLIQGDTEMITDLTEYFYGYPATSYFEPGEIRLRLDFINAEGVNISISW